MKIITILPLIFLACLSSCKKDEDVSIQQSCQHTLGKSFSIFASVPTTFKVKVSNSLYTFKGPVVWNIECTSEGCEGAMFNAAALNETKMLSPIMLQPIFETNIVSYSDNGAIIVGQSFADVNATQTFIIDFKTGKFMFKTITGIASIEGETTLGKCVESENNEVNNGIEL
jgi:hypothetical protein